MVDWFSVLLYAYLGDVKLQRCCSGFNLFFSEGHFRDILTVMLHSCDQKKVGIAVVKWDISARLNCESDQYSVI